jgi:hypothetical protein
MTMFVSHDPDQTLTGLTGCKALGLLPPFAILYSAKQAAAWPFLAELRWFMDVMASRTNHPQVKKMLNREFAAEFASQWISNWNARRVADVLSHFRDDCEFESPIAATITNSARLHSKEA